MIALNQYEYIVELWDNNNVYVADISEIISTNIRLSLNINDVSSCDLTIDMQKFLDKCDRIGAVPQNVLDPYRTDIKIRRNNKYLGAFQVIQIQGNFNKTTSNTIEIRATSYINLFKNRYVSAQYSNMTYAQIAAALINTTQAQTYGSFGIMPNIDLASVQQSATRVRNYDLQNVKDGIINLSKLDNDNFDFEFTADKKFNMYSRLGSNKANIELSYPQNIDSLTVLRDASTLANKIYGLGAGIGDERIESIAIDSASAAKYGVRERTELFNSVELQQTLDANTYGALARYAMIYERPAVRFNSYNLDLNDINLGDAITVIVEDNKLFDNIYGLYRIVNIDINLDKNFAESVSLTLIEWS